MDRPGTKCRFFSLHQSKALPKAGLSTSEIFCLRWFDPSLASSIIRVLREAGERAGIEGVCLKTLRDTFSARLYRHGASISSVRQLLGYRTIHLRLIRSTPAQLREAIDTLNRHRIF